MVFRMVVAGEEVTTAEAPGRSECICRCLAMSCRMLSFHVVCERLLLLPLPQSECVKVVIYRYIQCYIQLFCRACGISWLSSAQFSELQSLQLHQELRLSSMHWSFVLCCQCGSEENSAQFSTSQQLRPSFWFLLISFCNTY